MKERLRRVLAARVDWRRRGQHTLWGYFPESSVHRIIGKERATLER